ncbi:hypothetical protein TRFO_41104 [Tritrichomonas foetus]|uniref:Uncharacterized protein n=1 Tax=Tritrichomonas foetus TaxID=1144522 RepID=A0A1J4L1G3_9EUKA|nr:hypothetical protein TRFO_41104 [Tritrichomonas foetus]|eukprot:OHT17359.1 hypothetical protein TRFO_41104 [Tritrichomonas foetus]
MIKFIPSAITILFGASALRIAALKSLRPWVSNRDEEKLPCSTLGSGTISHSCWEASNNGLRLFASKVFPEPGTPQSTINAISERLNRNFLMKDSSKSNKLQSI